MGIDRWGAEFLLSADGVRFDSTCMIGRQGIHVPTRQLNRLLGSRGPVGESEFAEPLLERLGATRIESLDYSTFEGATIKHDLNSDAIPDAPRFSAVLDGGTLEHVFHVPNAFRAMMSLVEPGGHLLLIHPTNAESGHGFYQFSADLYYRVLCEENGFAVERCLLKEVGRPWYDVPDPAVVGHRVMVQTRRPSFLYVQARRVADVVPFASPPLQSDYVSAWQAGRTSAARWKQFAVRFAPTGLKRRIKMLTRSARLTGLTKVGPSLLP